MWPPKLSVLTAIALLLWCAGMCPAAGRVFAPAQEGPAGKRAFDLLGAIYVEETPAGAGQLDAAVDVAIKDLRADRVKADSAADFLLALFRQSGADQRNGRAEWKAQPSWGGGSESAARSIRRHVAEKLKDQAQGEGAVRVAQWLLGEEEEEDPACEAAAVEMLRRTRGERGDAALSGLLAQGTHFRPALLMALEQAGVRKLAVKPETLRPWARDPCESVRAAAGAAAQALGIEPPAAFKVEDGFGLATAKLLRDLASLLPDPIAREAAFGRFDVVERFGADSEKPYRSSLIGWKLSESPGETRAVSWYAKYYVLKTDEKSRTTVTFTALNPAGQVAEITRLRQASGKDAPRDLMRFLSARGALTGQFQSPQFTVPEALLSAWLFDKGDLPRAAELLFPRLDALDDDRWPLQIIRDLVGHQCHQRMLDAFTGGRDYAETLRLARHLAQPVFDGYQYQQRARELAAQIPGRMDDFKTFVLPTETEWKALAAPMNRAQQIEFLAARLRLLNCHQMSQPGGVDYGDPQSRDPETLVPVAADGKAPATTINPWNELRNLPVEPRDLAALAPLLKDDDYLPTYSYWRDFHPARTLHRVHWLVAALVNDAAKRELVDLRRWQELPAEERDQQVAGIVAWSREMADKPMNELLIANMAAARTDHEWLRAAREAARLKDPTTLPALLDGAQKYPEHEAEIANLCRMHGGPGAAAAARKWILSKTGGTRLQGTSILLRDGSEPEKAQALEALRHLLAGKWNDELHLAAIEPIIDSGHPAAIDLACALLRRKDLEWRWNGGEVARRLFLTGRPAALESILAALADTDAAEEQSGTWQGKSVSRKLVRADRAAEAIARFRQGFEYPVMAPDPTRAEKRKELAEWLKTQAALLAQKKPTPELDTTIRPIDVPHWRVDAP